MKCARDVLFRLSFVACLRHETMEYYNCCRYKVYTFCIVFFRDKKELKSSVVFIGFYILLLAPFSHTFKFHTNPNYRHEHIVGSCAPPSEHFHFIQTHRRGIVRQFVRQIKHPFWMRICAFAFVVVVVVCIAFR